MPTWRENLNNMLITKAVLSHAVLLSILKESVFLAWHLSRLYLDLCVQHTPQISHPISLYFFPLYLKETTAKKGEKMEDTEAKSKIKLGV